jgi:AraC-like DNA-binding protein
MSKEFKNYSLKNLNRNMKEVVTELPENITREEIAKWYGIKERALRLRMEKAKLHIQNRILTITDVALILEKLGVPRNLSVELYKYFMSFNDS